MVRKGEGWGLKKGPAWGTDCFFFEGGFVFLNTLQGGKGLPGLDKK